MIFKLTTLFNIATVGCYVAIWLILQQRQWPLIVISRQSSSNSTLGTMSTGNYDTTRRVFNSRMAIMVVVIVGWLVNSLLHILIPVYGGLSPVQEYVVFVAGGCFVVTASGANFPILYALR